MELLEATILTNTEYVFAEFSKTEIVPILLNLFFQFKWNNFLHQSVHNILATTISSPHEGINGSIFNNGSFITRLLAAVNEDAEEKKANPNSQTSGYIGHLTKLTTLIVARSESVQAIRAAALESPEVAQSWKEYVEGSYAERFQKESVKLGSKKVFAPVNRMPYNVTSGPMEVVEEEEEEDADAGTDAGVTEKNDDFFGGNDVSGDVTMSFFDSNNDVNSGNMNFFDTQQDTNAAAATDTNAGGDVDFFAGGAAASTGDADGFSFPSTIPTTTTTEPQQANGNDDFFAGAGADNNNGGGNDDFFAGGAGADSGADGFSFPSTIPTTTTTTATATTSEPVVNGGDDFFAGASNDDNGNNDDGEKDAKKKEEEQHQQQEQKQEQQEQQLDFFGDGDGNKMDVEEEK